MSDLPARGKFVAVEGPDGAGKSTLVRELAARMRNLLDVPVYETREPGGTAAGEVIRDLLLGDAPLCDRAELLLFAADAAQRNAANAAALMSPAWVVSDRWGWCSAQAYKVHGFGWPAAVVDPLYDYPDVCVPDWVFVLDAPDATLDARMGGIDRVEARPAEFHRRVRDYYRKLAYSRSDPQAYRIDTDGRDPAEIAGSCVRLMGLDS